MPEHSVLDREPPAAGGFSSTILTMTIVGLYASAPSALANLLTAFPCYDGVDERMMVYDPQADCWSHHDVTALAAVGIVGMLGVISWFLVFRFITRREVVVEAMTDGNAAAHRKARVNYGFLFLGYKPQYYYWELWVFARKCVVLAIVMLTPPTLDMAGRTALLQLFLVLSLVLQTHVRPYEEDRSPRWVSIHLMEIVTQSCSSISIALAMYVYYTQSNEGQQIATAAFALANSLWIVMILSRGFRPMLQMLQQGWQKAKGLVKRCCKCLSSTFDKADDQGHRRSAVMLDSTTVEIPYVAFQGSERLLTYRGPNLEHDCSQKQLHDDSDE